MKIGNQISYHKVLNIFQQKNSSIKYNKISNPVLASRTFASDTLNLVKDEQLLKSSVINDFIDTLPELYIVQRDIYGKLLSSSNSIGKIKATITGDSIPVSNPKIVELWYNSAANSYSGFVYFIYYLNIVNYNVYVDIINPANKFIGRSVNVPFNSMAGDVQIPDFNPGNAIPIANAGKDTTVSINDLIQLHGSVIDSFIRGISKWEWDIGNTGSFTQTSTSDTNIIAPYIENLNYQCVLMATDVDGNFAKDTVKIAALQDVPQIMFFSGDTTIEYGGTVRCSVYVKQQFGTTILSIDTANTNIFKEFDTLGIDGSGLYSFSTNTFSTWDSIKLRAIDDDGNVVTKGFKLDIRPRPISITSIDSTVDFVFIPM